MENNDRGKLPLLVLLVLQVLLIPRVLLVCVAHAVTKIKLVHTITQF